MTDFTGLAVAGPIAVRFLTPRPIPDVPEPLREIVSSGSSASAIPSPTTTSP
jgi:hypothetical protein